MTSVYDPGVTVDLATLRPAGFGKRNVREIRDPVVEPLWRGDRVLVEAAGGQVTFRDVEGAALETDAAIVAALEQAIQAESALIDGYLTYQPTQPSHALLVGSEVPTAGQMASQIFVGKGLKSRAMRPIEQLESKNAARNAAPPDHPLAFVAIDLLLIDGQSLLGIPLLERKRLLESVLQEAELVRRTPYVRLPVDAWLASWRSMGFRELAYKAANGRYFPGERNDDWALVTIPSG